MINGLNTQPVQGRDCPLTVTSDSLPAADTTRWVASRKAQIVTAVETGLLSLEEVLRRYKLSLEEYQTWHRAMTRAGIRGLRVAWAQEDRAERRRSRLGNAGSLHKTARV